MILDSLSELRHFYHKNFSLRVQKKLENASISENASFWWSSSFWLVSWFAGCRSTSTSSSKSQITKNRRMTRLFIFLKLLPVFEQMMCLAPKTSFNLKKILLLQVGLGINPFREDDQLVDHPRSKEREYLKRQIFKFEKFWRETSLRALIFILPNEFLTLRWKMTKKLAIYEAKSVKDVYFKLRYFDEKRSFGLWKLAKLKWPTN